MNSMTFSGSSGVMSFAGAMPCSGIGCRRYSGRALSIALGTWLFIWHCVVMTCEKSNVRFCL